MLRDSTRFLPYPLRPQEVVDVPPLMNTYTTGQPFENYAVNEHGSYEYLFKLACAALDDDVFPSEIERADVYRQDE